VSERSKVDGLTDDERRGRTLVIDRICQQIKDEHAELLAELGMIPIVKRVWDYSVEQHVAHARERGIELSLDAQRIQREYLDLLRSASKSELTLVTSLLMMILDLDRARKFHPVDLVNDVISIAVFAEGMLERRESV